MEWGPFARRHGAIGQSPRWAIFPDVATGRAAQDALLEGPLYIDLTLDEAVKRYAPRCENDTARYQQTVRDRLGLPGTTVLRDLSPDQMRVLKDTIRRVEA